MRVLRSVLCCVYVRVGAARVYLLCVTHDMSYILCMCVLVDTLYVVFLSVACVLCECVCARVCVYVCMFVVCSMRV